MMSNHAEEPSWHGRSRDMTPRSQSPLSSRYRASYTSHLQRQSQQSLDIETPNTQSSASSQKGGESYTQHLRHQSQQSLDLEPPRAEFPAPTPLLSPAPTPSPRSPSRPVSPDGRPIYPSTRPVSWQGPVPATRTSYLPSPAPAAWPRSSNGSPVYPQGHQSSPNGRPVSWQHHGHAPPSLHPPPRPPPPTICPNSSGSPISPLHHHHHPPSRQSYDLARPTPSYPPLPSLIPDVSSPGPSFSPTPPNGRPVSWQSPTTRTPVIYLPTSAPATRPSSSSHPTPPGGGRHISWRCNHPNHAAAAAAAAAVYPRQQMVYAASPASSVRQPGSPRPSSDYRRAAAAASPSSEYADGLRPPPSTSPGPGSPRRTRQGYTTLPVAQLPPPPFESEKKGLATPGTGCCGLCELGSVKRVGSFVASWVIGTLTVVLAGATATCAAAAC